MQASTSSSRSSSATEVTATSATAGWRRSTLSTSAALIFSPLRRMMFFLRSTKCRLPSRSARTMSPGVKPAARPGGFGDRGFFEVLGEEAGARVTPGGAHQQFAVVRDDARFDRRRGPAEAVRTDMARLMVGDHDRAGAGLGHGPGLQQREAE